MSDSSQSLTQFFTLDHRRCDSSWVEVESAAEAGDAEAVQERWRTFRSELLKHLQMEEEVLFPAFEQASGMTTGKA